MRAAPFFCIVLFQRPIQHLLIVPRFRGVEGLAAEKLEIGLVEVGHGQLPRTEGLIFELQFAVGGVVAVLAVAEDGAADAPNSTSPTRPRKAVSVIPIICSMIRLMRMG